MKKIKGFLLLVFLFSLLCGCNETAVVDNSNFFNYSVNVWDYSDSYFFIDTLYKSSFLAVMNDSTGSLPGSVLMNKIRFDIPSFQVWVQCDNTVPLKKTATAWIMLTEKPYFGYDSAKYKRKENILDSCFFGFFRELNPSEYYINPLAGFIGLKINVPEDYAVAVTYETMDGKKFGVGKYETNVNETMILKMVKCANQSPDATPRAWELKMKNVYSLPIKNTTDNLFVLDAYYNDSSVWIKAFHGYNYTISTMLLLDRYTGSIKRWQPDYKFDYIVNRTIIPETGDIIFPTLKPFSDELSKAGLDSAYLFNEIYTLRKSEAQSGPKANMYRLIGYAQGSR